MTYPKRKAKAVRQKRSVKQHRNSGFYADTPPQYEGEHNVYSPEHDIGKPFLVGSKKRKAGKAKGRLGDYLMGGYKPRVQVPEEDDEALFINKKKRR